LPFYESPQRIPVIPATVKKVQGELAETMPIRILRTEQRAKRHFRLQDAIFCTNQVHSIS
jgi:hypothetical protein